ncbi:hypothetical protein CO583_04415 [Parasaccharibacter sp. TMW2.1882]|uniref:Uncharacterized protein n=3 Tax=Acetobacterales TaxID=3120395 RepID=A0A7U7IZK3_9PROT|nr:MULTISPECIES: hypothetical protein [Acetobacteraceae]MCL1563006.1 hypothetical protein [Parasaccharibacter sp. TMW 2.1886]MUG78894.1 hypothetical protein [Bombella sp. ESL0380]MUH02212.1 hypothetical protein [Bombella sp. ESL0387]QGT74637.1 hypothetical protein GN304_01865 [Bombella sp. ESL0368]MBE1724181.1 hypothetical protein [Bombella apis]
MMRTTLCMTGLSLMLLAGSLTDARAQTPLDVAQDGTVTTSGLAALGVSPNGGQRLGQTGKWQMLELDHTLTALLAENDVMLSASPRRGGDVFLMFVLKNHEIHQPELEVRFSNGYEVKGFHYTGIINRGTQWGCYVSEAEGHALFDALAGSTSVSMSWAGGAAHIDFDHGDEFVRTLAETAWRGNMPFPK